jgi:hypothetical protein
LKGKTVSHLLSKSRYLSGLQCVKRLWIEIHKPELIPEPAPSQKKIFDQGTEVGRLARERFLRGVLIEADHESIGEAIHQTKAALTSGAEIIFEGAFATDSTLVRPDVIRKIGQDDWELIEVKSSTQVKPENLQDVAIQTYTLRTFGLNVTRMTLMHINNQCVFPDLSNLFTQADVTEKVDRLQAEIPAKVNEFLRVLQSDSEPEIRIGAQCSSPYDCPLRGYCWSWVPKYSIFNIPGLQWSKKAKLLADDLVDLETIPDDFKLNDAQSRFLNSYDSKMPIIDWDGIHDILSTLKYPIYFLDFETDNPAIPRLEGTHPYEQFPFQFSCHILQENGDLTHAEYLHRDLTDPRQTLCEALLDILGDSGAIIAYNAAFEIGRLKQLADWFPQHKPRINSIISRVWDQLKIFKQHYSDYRFGGSNSIKHVLPIIVPSMSYENLEVPEGGAAQIAWNEMIRLPESPEKSKLITNLKTYCGQDTLAMVEIHRFLLNGMRS